MRSLKTIQKLSSLGSILSKIAFVLSVVGFCGCIAGLIGLRFGSDAVLKLGSACTGCSPTNMAAPLAVDGGLSGAHRRALRSLSADPPGARASFSAKSRSIPIPTAAIRSCPRRTARIRTAIPLNSR